MYSSTLLNRAICRCALFMCFLFAVAVAMMSACAEVCLTVLAELRYACAATAIRACSLMRSSRCTSAKLMMAWITTANIDTYHS